MSILRKVFRRVVYGGSSSFEAVEAFIIENVANHLSRQDRQTLQTQIKNVELIQREQNDRMVLTLFADGENTPLLQSQEQNHCLAKVTFTVKGKRYQTAVMTHRGRLSSLEFDPAAPRISAAEPIEMLSVDLTPVDYRSISKSIDQEEHS